MSSTADLEALAHTVGVLHTPPPVPPASAGEWLCTVATLIISYPLLAGVLLLVGGDPA